VDSLPIFPGRTEVDEITPGSAPESKSATFADGTTKTWTTAPTPGVYRVTYSNISDEELSQLKTFLAEHGVSKFWRCTAPNSKLEHCYFPEHERIFCKRSDADRSRWNANLRFFVRYTPAVQRGKNAK
jgi:hypothetical protein